LEYDTATLKAVDVLPTTMLNGSYWKANTLLGGEVRFAFATTEQTTGHGNLLMVEFEVLPGTDGKTSPLIFSNVDLSNSLSITKVDGSITVVPSKSLLLQNYPNPFNPDTWLPYQLAKDTPVVIRIYNPRGQLVRLIELGNQRAGVYLSRGKAAYWDGRNQTGESAASGLYFYALQAGDFRAIRRMAIVK